MGNSDAILILDNSVPRFEISESTDGYTVTSTLVFTEIVFGDGGRFECIAENVHAVSSNTASLEVYGRLNFHVASLTIIFNNLYA